MAFFVNIQHCHELFLPEAGGKGSKNMDATVCKKRWKENQNEEYRRPYVNIGNQIKKFAERLLRTSVFGPFAST